MNNKTLRKRLKKGDFKDIENWDVSNVTDMSVSGTCIIILYLLLLLCCESLYISFIHCQVLFIK
jgi:hypothetical protein